MPATGRLVHPEDIDAVDLIRVRVPLLEPFVASHGTQHDREVVLVRVIGASGTAGWGECVALAAPTYSTEWTGGAWLALRDEIVPRALAGETLPLDGRRMAWAALESAEYDVLLREGRAPGAAETGARRHAVRCGVVIGRTDDLAALLDAVSARLAEGFTQVKLKIGPGWDVEPLRAVRQRWPDLALAADANGSYTTGDIARLAELDRYRLAYLEQPFPAADLAAHGCARGSIATPVALDESISSAEDLRRSIDADAVDVVNVKPGRVGGWRETAAIRRELRGSSVRAFVGGMLETGVGRAFALHVASFDVFTLPTDVGPSSRYVARDLTDPVTMRTDGTIEVPSGPGFGAAVQANRVEEFTIDMARIHRRSTPGTS